MRVQGETKRVSPCAGFARQETRGSELPPLYVCRLLSGLLCGLGLGCAAFLAVSLAANSRFTLRTIASASVSTLYTLTDARTFGLLSSIMAIGAISGALIAAGRDKPKFGSLFAGSEVFGIGCAFAALAPGYWWFAAHTLSLAFLL